MQKVHELSQPIWIVTHAAWSTSRRPAARRGRLVLLEDLYHRFAAAAGLGQERGGVGQVVRTEHHVDVAGPLHDQVTVLLGRQPPTAIWSPGRRALRACSRPSWP